MKKLLMIFVLCLLMVVSVACGNNQDQTPPDTESSDDSVTETAGSSTEQEQVPSQAEVRIKFANNGVTDPEHPQNKAMEFFKEQVEEKSDGKIFVELFIAGSLGDARTIMEGVQLGTIEMGDVENGAMSGFVPEAAIWDLPYLFTTLEHAHTVLDGEVGQHIQGLYENVGIKHLAYNDGGFRYFTNSKLPITNVDDLKGLKIRVMESRVMIDTINAFGASAVPMAFQELYTAMQQKTVDGQENPLDLIYAQNYHEVQKYLALSEHFYYPRQYVINKDFLEGLSEEFQTIITETALEACNYQRDIYAPYVAEMLDKLKERGFQVDEFDKTKAMELSEEVWPGTYEIIGSGDAAYGEELIQKIIQSR